MPIHPDNKCPKCQHPLPVADRISGDTAKPSPFDLSLCISCASILIFKLDSTGTALRSFTPTEGELAASELLQPGLIKLLTNMQADIVLDNTTRS